MVLESIIDNLFFQAFLIGLICIAIRIGFQLKNPDKFFYVRLCLTALAGTQFIAIVLYFSQDGIVIWWNYFAILLGGLVFVSLDKLANYIFSGKPITIAALFEEFLKNAAKEYNPLLTQALQWLVDNYQTFDVNDLIEYLKGKKMEALQADLQRIKGELMELNKQ